MLKIMNNVNEKIISTLCKMSGKSRTEVIETLRKMSNMPEVQKHLKQQRSKRN